MTENRRQGDQRQGGGRQRDRVAGRHGDMDMEIRETGDREIRRKGDRKKGYNETGRRGYRDM